MLMLLCLGCVLLAVWLAVPPPSRPAQRSLPVGAPSSGQRPAAAVSAGRMAGMLVVTVGVIAVSAILGGPRGAVLGTAGVVVGLTVRGVLRQSAARRTERRAGLQVARGCSLLASHLRIGLVPSEALAAAAAEVPVLREGSEVLKLGGDPTRLWLDQARRGGHGGLCDLARAWQVSTRTGAPMSATLDQVSAGLAADQSLAAVVASELSAPRATGKVMAALPVCGIVIGYLLGGDPVSWLLDQPVGWACLLGGVLLACLGVLWIEALARRAVGRR
jgi:tight adherence protein B